MRLSDAGMRKRATTLIYCNHRLPPRLTEDVARDRLNRLLEADRSDHALLRARDCGYQIRNQ
jgi:hypothetical protein